MGRKEEEMKNSIKNWPEDDRPREKLFRQGDHTLSDAFGIGLDELVRRKNNHGKS